MALIKRYPSACDAAARASTTAMSAGTGSMTTARLPYRARD